MDTEKRRPRRWIDLLDDLEREPPVLHRAVDRRRSQPLRICHRPRPQHCSWACSTRDPERQSHLSPHAHVLLAPLAREWEEAVRVVLAPRSRHGRCSSRRRGVERLRTGRRTC